MERSLKHFRELKKCVLDTIGKSAKKESNYYIVRDVFGRISVYIEGNDSIELWRERLKKNIDKWLMNVQKITSNDIIYDEVVKKNRNNKGNIFFQERPLVKGVWNQNADTVDKTSDIKSKVITFYSYKGGLGRTTTLSMVALNLVRQGNRVVVLDFDLEAPGVATILRPSDGEYPQYGVIDYLIEGRIENDLDIDEYVYPVTSKKIIGVNGGSLFIMQAANEEDGVGEYYNKLSRLDFNAPQYQSRNNPIANLLKTIDDRYSPDYVLIDSRAGIHDIGGLAMMRYSDEVALLFYGNRQNVFGMKFVLSRLVDQGIPFYLINSPVPTAEEAAAVEREIYINNAYDILVKKEYYKKESLPDVNDEIADHYPVDIAYNDFATTLINDMQIENLLTAVHIYDKIAQDLAEKEDVCESALIDNGEYLSSVIDSIEKITDNNAPAAENELKTKTDLKNNFYPLKEYRYIFDWDKFLILGPKGSGKTALFSVLNCSDYARSLAEYLGVSSKDTLKTYWLTGLNKEKGFPRKDHFRRIAENNRQAGYRAYWLCLMVRTLSGRIEEYVTDVPSVFYDIKNCKYSALNDIINKNGNISEQLLELLDELDKKLAVDNKAFVLTYDALDVLLEKPYRGDMLAALIDLWFENIVHMKNIRAKIFLREDIFKVEVQKGITDKIKVKNYTANLEWNYDCLLAMVWKRMAEKDKNGTQFLQMALEREGYSLPNVNKTIGYVPIPNEEINKIVLNRLVGERMGKGKKAYTYNWIQYRLSDTKGNIVPRSILKLFSFAAKKEKESNITRVNKNSILHPNSLENSMEEVSVDRIRDISEEYEAYRDIFNNLKNYCQLAPINNDDLISALKACGVLEDKMQSTIDELIEIGILREYRRKKTDPIRYHIPDIYLRGLGMNRKGYR